MNLDRERLKDTVARGVTALHTQLYRRTGGRLGSQVGKTPMLLLTTTGRRSGQPRTVPLAYLREGDRWILVASYAGDDRDPQWLQNLRAHPEASIEVGSETHRVHASVASPAEKAELWPRVVALYSGYAGYQDRTERDIPLVILSPQ